MKKVSSGSLKTKLKWKSTLKEKSLAHGIHFLHSWNLERRHLWNIFSEALPVIVTRVTLEFLFHKLIWLSVNYVSVPQWHVFFNLLTKMKQNKQGINVNGKAQHIGIKAVCVQCFMWSGVSWPRRTYSKATWLIIPDFWKSGITWHSKWFSRDMATCLSCSAVFLNSLWPSSFIVHFYFSSTIL